MGGGLGGGLGWNKVVFNVLEGVVVVVGVGFGFGVVIVRWFVCECYIVVIFVWDLGLNFCK